MVQFKGITTIVLLLLVVVSVESFAPLTACTKTRLLQKHEVPISNRTTKSVFQNNDEHYLSPTAIYAQNDGQDGSGSTSNLFLSNDDQITLGVVGTKMSLIMLVSEYVLKTTGCGLPAGPYGIVGAAEGISYLGVTALATFSIYTKVKTGSGLPAGPYKVLGLAEGLSFLALGVGVAVLIFQLGDYGYIPNAVPMEGGMCQ